VNLPANIVYGAFRLGKVASNYMFDAVITAAAKKGKAKVLSDPKIATLNNKEANINITTQIPYTTTEITAATPPISTTKVTYLTTGIILKVTPTINSDGRISMKISPSVSQPNATIVPVAGGAPGIDTRSADTNVIVRNGETIVIGGLIHDTQSEAVFKVPILGDIPLLGYLFKKKSVSRSRMELLIFVTPRVLED
jgi:type IV pilus assembly protein PilQ